MVIVIGMRARETEEEEEEEKEAHHPSSALVGQPGHPEALLLAAAMAGWGLAAY